MSRRLTIAVLAAAAAACHGSSDATVSPPEGLTYSANPAVYTVGVEVTPNVPSSTGGEVASYSVSPALPPGLVLDGATGRIAGTPSAVSALASYTVTASNSGGATTATLTITVNDVRPGGLAYAVNPAIYTKGVPATPNAPSASGGAVVTWSVLPALPAGLSLDPATGVVSGTPSTIVPEGAYTVTATNSGGSATVDLRVAVIKPATGVRLSLSVPAATNELIVAVDGGALAAPQVTDVTGDGMTSASVTLGLPAGGPYRIRAIAIDPRSNPSTLVVAASGMATGVSVTDEQLTAATVTLAAPEVQISAPASVTAGSEITIAWTYTDPGAALDRPGELDGRLWYGTAPFQDVSSPATQVRPTGEKLSETSYRFTATIRAPSTPGTLWYQLSAVAFDLSALDSMRAAWFVDPCGARGEALGAITVAPITTGATVDLTSPVPTNEFIVAVDGGGLSAPLVSDVTGSGMTSASVTVGVPAGGPYRIRAIAIDPRSNPSTLIVAASGMAAGVTIAEGSVTGASVALAAPEVQITAPASATAGSEITIAWTYTDPGAALDRPGELDGRLWYDAAPFQDVSSPATQVRATGEKLSETSYRFTATIRAPSTPGTLWYQLSALAFDLSTLESLGTAWFVDPCGARGEALGAITVAPITTGATVDLTSPAPANEFIVAVDGGGLSAPLVSAVTGSGMTSASVTVGVPAGGPYRIRAIAIDPRSNPSTLVVAATGMAAGVTIAEGSVTGASVALAPVVVQISAPSWVTTASEITIAWTYTDPGAALDRPGELDGRLWYGAAPFQDVSSPATQVRATGEKLSETSYRFTATLRAPSTPGTLRYQLSGLALDLSTLESLGTAWFVDPCGARGEELGTITVY